MGSTTPLAVFSPVVLKRSALLPWCVALPLVLPRECTDSAGGVALPVVLLESASTPLAVLRLPVVLLKSALTPLAVFWLPVCC